MDRLRKRDFSYRVFAIEIHSQQSEKTKHDWRHYDFDKVAHCVHELPDRVRNQCLALVQALDLRFGAIELIVTPNNEYVFLEINPTGQYQWLEALTDLPITDSIVELLINGPLECWEIWRCIEVLPEGGGDDSP
jgi:hypothetical protein